jgi:hypothetical protein
MTNIRDMIPQIRRKLACDQELAALSRRCTELSEPCLELDYMISRALGLPASVSLLTSMDACVGYLRERFPAPVWRYGFQDAGFKGYTGPTAWLNNGECQKVGFDNRINHTYRYFERCGQRIEFAFAALILHAESFQTCTADELAVA